MKDSVLLGKEKGNGSSPRGALTGGCLLCIILIGLLAYVGFRIGEAYWNYFEVRQKIQEALNWAVAGSPKAELEIMQKVIAKAREGGVELSPQSIKIKQTKTTITIIAAWEQEVEFPYYTLPLEFKVSLTEEKHWARRGLK